MNRVRGAGIFLLAAGLPALAQTQPDVGPGVQVFPPDNPWNWDISGHAVHPSSAAYVSSMGASTLLRDDPSFHITVVGALQANVTVTFTGYPDESDPGPGFGSPPGGAASGSYPIPPGAQIEASGDAHVLVVNTGTKLLYETYQTVAGPPWSAACGAVFDLDSNALRPDGWTSSDAAGLPIFPGLLRYEEVAAGSIPHALRVTASSTQDTYLYPARHQAGSANANLPPMGLRLRLKAGYDISGYTGAARVVLEALKKHGLIVADNGSSWYISSTVDSRWASINITAIRNVPGNAFEAVVTVDAGGNPIPPAGGGGGGGGGHGGCGAVGAEALLALWVLARLRARHSPSPGNPTACRGEEGRPKEE